LDLLEYAKKKLGSFYEFNEKEQEVTNYNFDTIKLDGKFEKRSDFQADFAIINATFLKLKDNFYGTKDKLIKFLVKILSQAIMMSDVIVLLINKEISLMDVPEIFEKSFNSCLKL